MEGLDTSRQNCSNKSTDTSNNKGKERGFAYGLYEFNIKIRNRLFMTGTPRNYPPCTKVVEALPTRTKSNGERVFIENGEYYTTNILSFNNSTLFGPCLAKRSHQESVQKKVTLPISLYFSDTEVFREHSASQDTSTINNNDDTGKCFYLTVAIQSAFYKLKVKHTVSFHSTNQRARDFK